MARGTRTLEILNEISKGYEHFDSTFDYSYDEYNDYEMHSVAPSKALAKMWKYLHYLNHIFALMQEAMRDIIKRMEDNEKDIDDLLLYMHVPSKLQKTDDTHTYIKVLNENRTIKDGLNPDLVDNFKQLHLLDTSELDDILDNLLENQGIETTIVGGFVPAEDTCTKLGDTSKYQEIKIYWSSLIFSIPRTYTIMDKSIGGKSSFVFPNITDDPTSKKVVHGEIGQTLCEIKGTVTNSEICFYGSQLFRFENDIGSGDNNSWNRFNKDGNNVQVGGSLNISTSYWEGGTNPNYGKGWLNILKITGVNYGKNAAKMDLKACVARAKDNNYIGFNDYYRNLKYAMSGGMYNEHLHLLSVMENYKEELNNIFAPKPNTQDEVITAYDSLLLYRASLDKKGVK